MPLLPVAAAAAASIPTLLIAAATAGPCGSILYGELLLPRAMLLPMLPRAMLRPAAMLLHPAAMLPVIGLPPNLALIAETLCLLPLAVLLLQAA